MAAEPRLRQEGFHTHPQRLQIILQAYAALQGQQQRSKLWEDWPVA